MLRGDADQDVSSKKANNKLLVRTDFCTHLSIMIYFLYLAWVLAVRRDTQGNQWNVQTCRTVCNERVRRTDAMMRCHRRYAIAMAHLLSVIGNKSGVLLADDTALRRIVINITCGQKRHTRNSGSTYLSERMPEQMLQVGQTFGTDATSSKTLLADDTALRRIVIRTSKSAPQTTVLDHFHLHMRVSPQWQAILPQ